MDTPDTTDAPETDEEPKSPHARLRAWRKRRGYTQDVAAKRLGLSQAMVSDLEQGKRGPSRDDAIVIERETGIAIEAWSDDPRIAEAMDTIVRQRATKLLRTGTE
jgi:transcriptional regulator with XRE-family HTH domain